jgi:hypothetical protein
MLLKDETIAVEGRVLIAYTVDLSCFSVQMLPFFFSVHSHSQLSLIDSENFFFYVYYISPFHLTVL